MNFHFNPPAMLRESQQAQKGFHIFLEILLFIGIFLISQILIGLLANIPVIAYMFSTGIFSQIASGSLELPALQEKIMVPSMISMLYAELPGIFMITLLCLGIQKRKMKTLGFRKGSVLKEYGIGMLAGFSMITLVFLLALAAGSLKVRFDPQSLSPRSLSLLLVIFVGFLFQGMFEEVLCRGYFLISLSRRSGNLWMGIIVSSLAFAALHLLNPGISPLAILNLTLFGIFAGIYFIKRGNLWGIGALHSLWNFTQGNVWGILVSGGSFGVSFFTSEPEETMALLNGGSFGLEGGLITTAVLILSSLAVLRLPQKEEAQLENSEISLT